MGLYRFVSVLILGVSLTSAASADEHLFGYVKGAETLPKGTLEFVQWLTSRNDKGKVGGEGSYHAVDTKTEVEYGVTDRFTTAAYLKAQSIHLQGLTVDGYLPKDESYGLKPSGVETSMKYNFLSPAKDDIGLASYFSLNYSWLDTHSGQEKDKVSAEMTFILQKYFFEGQMIWAGNAGMESTYAKRAAIADLPAGFEWPTAPEMELEIKFGTGLSYRFLPNWFFGAETEYEAEYETEVGRERWSIFAGPSLHYGSEKWWGTLTWYPQLSGGPDYPDQTVAHLHLVEKTKDEFRLKVGFEF